MSLESALKELQERKDDPTYWQELHEHARQRAKAELEKWEREQVRLEKKYNKQQEQGLGYKWPVYAVTCQNCGRIFYTERADHDRLKFCRETCQRERANKLARWARRMNRIKTCLYCGETFIGKKSNSLYCSHACKQKAYRARRVTASKLDNDVPSESRNV